MPYKLICYCLWFPRTDPGLRLVGNRSYESCDSESVLEQVDISRLLDYRREGVLLIIVGV